MEDGAAEHVNNLRQEALTAIERSKAGDLTPMFKAVQSCSECLFDRKYHAPHAHWFCDEEWRPFAQLCVVLSSFDGPGGDVFFRDLRPKLAQCPRCVRIYRQILARLAKDIREIWRIPEAKVQKWEFKLQDYHRKWFDEYFQETFELYKRPQHQQPTAGQINAIQGPLISLLYDSLYCPWYFKDDDSTNKKFETVRYLMEKVQFFSNIDHALFIGVVPMAIVWSYEILGSSASQSGSRTKLELSKSLLTNGLVGAPITSMDLPTLQAWESTIQEYGQRPSSNFWANTAMLFSKLDKEFLKTQLSDYLKEVPRILQDALITRTEDAALMLLQNMFHKLDAKYTLQLMAVSSQLLVDRMLSSSNFTGNYIRWLSPLLNEEASRKSDTNAINTACKIAAVMFKLSHDGKEEFALGTALSACMCALQVETDDTQIPLISDVSRLLRETPWNLTSEYALVILDACRHQNEEIRKRACSLVEKSIQMDIFMCMGRDMDAATKMGSKSLWNMLVIQRCSLLRDPLVASAVLKGLKYSPFLVRPPDSSSSSSSSSSSNNIGHSSSNNNNNNTTNHNNSKANNNGNNTNTSDSNNAVRYKICLDVIQLAVASLRYMNDMDGRKVEGLLTDGENLISVFLSSFSYNTEQSQLAVDFLCQAFDDTGSRHGALRTLLRNHSCLAMQCFNEALSTVTNLKRFSVCLKVIRMGQDFLSALYGHDSVIDNAFRDKLSSGDENELLCFWNNSWAFLRFSCLNTRIWGTEYNRALMKEFFRDEADFCRDLLERFRMFEADIPAQNSGQTNGSLLAAPVAEAVVAMCDLLQLRDVGLLVGCFNNIMKILELMNSFQVPCPTSLVEFSVKCASRELNSNLTDDNLSQLVDQLFHMDAITEEKIAFIQERALSRRKRRHGETVSPAPQTTLPTSALPSAASAAAVAEHPPSKKQKHMMDYFVPTVDNRIPTQLPSLSKPVEPSAPTRVSKLDMLRADIKANKTGLGANAMSAAVAAAKPVKEVHPARPAGFNSKRSAAAAAGADNRNEAGAVPGVESESESDEEDGLFKEKKTAKPTTTLPPTLRNINKPGFQAGAAMVGQRNRSSMLQRPKVDEETALRQRLNVDLSPLHSKILKWDYHLSKHMPGEEEQLRALKDSYSTVEEYQKAFEPLLLLESWQGIIKAKEENVDMQRPFLITIGRRVACNDYQEVYASIDPQTMSVQRLAEADLVVLSYFRDESTNARLPDSSHPHCFARVQSVQSHQDYVDVVLKTYAPSNMLQNLGQRTMIHGLKVLSLTSMEREYSSLKGLKYYDLQQSIVSAEPRKCMPIDSREVASTMKSFGVNESQANAILASLAETSGFQLIQGPPGTGKTKTILSIIGSYLTSKKIVPIDQYESSSVPKRKRILVCAPSNAAVDELVVRLKAGIFNTQGGLFQPTIVRLGRSEAINAQVRSVTLEELIDREVKADVQSSDKKNELREKQRATVRKRNEVRMILDDKTNELTAQEVNDLTQELTELNQKVKELGRQLDVQREQQITELRQREAEKRKKQAQILCDAQVICTTLSGSAHNVLSSLKIRFDTVIIDEAAQCIELSCLIPLRYGCKHCIMVGDPNQLPPTVLSQAAANLKYEQSLFVRMFTQYPDRVYLLNTQFRMHPAISRFPSLEFYDGKLFNGDKMSMITAKAWHKDRLLGPYRFFDVIGKQENAKQTRSLYNRVEAECAYELFSKLVQEYPEALSAGEVGIISPYKRQVVELKNLFQQRLGESHKLIDFNTVDGFQGQEKTVIILSCVRAQPDAKSVGFLSDVRRLNVAVTRAKSSLWILGHERCLVKNVVWNDLIQDAKERSMFFKISPGFTRNPDLVREVHMPARMSNQNNRGSQPRSSNSPAPSSSSSVPTPSLPQGSNGTTTPISPATGAAPPLPRPPPPPPSRPRSAQGSPSRGQSSKPSDSNSATRSRVMPPPPPPPPPPAAPTESLIGRRQQSPKTAPLPVPANQSNNPPADPRAVLFPSNDTNSREKMLPTPPPPPPPATPAAPKAILNERQRERSPPRSTGAENAAPYRQRSPSPRRGENGPPGQQPADRDRGRYDQRSRNWNQGPSDGRRHYDDRGYGDDRRRSAYSSSYRRPGPPLTYNSSMSSHKSRDSRYR